MARKQQRKRAAKAAHRRLDEIGIAKHKDGNRLGLRKRLHLLQRQRRL